MWIFTTCGFVSAVQDWNDTGCLLVRARDRASLESLATATKTSVEHSPDADYPYRLQVSKDAFATWIAQQGTAIDYPNFKSEVAASRGAKFAGVLGKVWSILHEVEDPSARHRPDPTKQAAPSPPLQQDMTVRPFTIARIKQSYPVHGAVLPDSTAVISFGNPNTARVATLGINPSHGEFANTNLRRLSDFEVTTPSDLSVAQAREVAHACYNYFTSAKPYKWFKSMEEFAVLPSGASYYNGTACHLDLSPWATKPIWKELPLDVREQLLEADTGFLRDQLREHAFEAILVNGRQALEVFQEEFTELEFVTSIPHSAGKKSSVYVGHLGATPVVGWSLNIPDSFTPNIARVALADFLRDWFGTEL